MGKIMRKINDNPYIIDLSSNMAMSKTFNVAYLHSYYPTKQLYSDSSSRMSSFEEGGTDVRDQDENDLI